MSFEQKVDSLAAAQKAQKLAEIERLLGQNTGKLLRASELRAPQQKPTEPSRPLIDLLCNGARITNSAGPVLICENRVPVAPNGEMHPRGYDFAPAPTRPLCPQDMFSDVLEFLSGDELLRDVPLEKFAFFDIESTGLAGASGTYPILVGVGYFVKTSAPHADNNNADFDPAAYEFVCEQLFLEDYCYEEALLTELRERLGNFDAFVTYNGKTFDVPLLSGRYIMNRMKIDLQRPHLDLLHIVRRIFRSRLGRCNLGNVEEHVLRLTREHDIDGSLVPQIYFNYLRGLWPERLVPVFDHNAQDIISMGSLLLLLVECVCDPGHPAVSEPHDLAALGRLYQRRGQLDRAVDYFERASLHSREQDLTNRVLADLARIYKKLGRHAEAIDLWDAECRRAGIRSTVAYVELLKLLEHETKDFERAMELILHAQQQIGERAHYTAMELQAELAKRRTRIEKKMAKK